MRYVWDAKKARANQKKHGVSFVEAVTAFADRLGIIVDDEAHSERAILIGMSGISARLATRQERRRHEEGE